MKLYIAGPMRGFPLYNFPAFDEAAAKLRAVGYEVISPAEMDRAHGFDPAKDEATTEFVEAALGRDCAAIMEVDGVALLPGYANSHGAMAEIRVALNLDKRMGSVDYFVAEARQMPGGGE